MPKRLLGNDVIVYNDFIRGFYSMAASIEKANV